MVVLKLIKKTEQKLGFKKFLIRLFALFTSVGDFGNAFFANILALERNKVVNRTAKNAGVGVFLQNYLISI